MMTTINSNQAHTLTDLIAVLRTDWDRPGIVAALRANATRGDFPMLALAAVKAATDPGSRTPAAISHTPHWQGNPHARTPEPPPIDQLCDHGRDRDLCGCGTRAAAENDWSEISRRGAAAARAHIARAIPHHAEEASA